MSDTRQDQHGHDHREKGDEEKVDEDKRDRDKRDGAKDKGGTGQASVARVSRRRLLGTAGAAGAAGLALGAVGGATGYAAGRPAEATALTTVGTGSVPFHGAHQPGITTPMHARGHLIAFDLAPGAGRKEAAALLRRWSASARAMMAGEPAGNHAGGGAGGGHDTGIALDAGPSSLTVTFGFGRSVLRPYRPGRAPARRPGSAARLLRRSTRRRPQQR